MHNLASAGGLGRGLGCGLILSLLSGTALGAGGPMTPGASRDDLYNQGGPWRPSLVAKKPAELPGPFVLTSDEVNGEQVNQALMPPMSVFAACFDPFNPPTPEMMARVEAAMREAIDESGVKYQLTGRWTGSQGDPRALTWSFVPDGLSIPSASGVGDPTAPSELFARMDSLFAAQGGRATWINRFQQVFDRWSQVSGLTYTRISGNPGNADADDGSTWSSSGSATRGDLRIAMKNIDGGSGILAYNFFPATGTGGNMVLDRSESWGSTTNFNRFLRNTISHEHGHGMGLLHVCPASGTKLMEPFLNTGFDGPRQDDIRAAQRHYGDPSEPDNTIGAARDRGALNRGATINLGTPPAPISGTNDPQGCTLSIDANGEQDFHRITPSQALLATVTVTPFGSSYADYPQDSACNNSVVNTNAGTAANLAVEIVDGAGNIIAQAQGAAAGAVETFNNVFLAGGVQYFVRVFETDAPTQLQLYRLAIAGANTSFTTTATDGVRGGVTVNWSAIPNAADYFIYRNGTQVGTVAGGITTFLDSAAPKGVDHTYEVRVKQGGVEAAGVAQRSLGVTDIGWTPCPADVSGPVDGVPDKDVDLTDFFYFLNCFDNSDPCAEVDGNPGIDLGDFFEYLNAFDAGC